jgi:hypothetical protein
VHSVASGGSPAYASVEAATVDANGNEATLLTYDWTPYGNIVHTNNRVTGVSATGALLKSTNSTYVQTAPYYNSGSLRHYNLLSRAYTTGAGPGSGASFAYDNPTSGNPTSEWHFDSTQGGSASSFTTNAILIQRTFDALGQQMGKTARDRLRTPWRTARDRLRTTVAQLSVDVARIGSLAAGSAKYLTLSVPGALPVDTRRSRNDVFPRGAVLDAESCWPAPPENADHGE